jgi:hypothetical protein
MLANAYRRCRKDRKEYLYKTRKTWVKKDRSDKWCLVVRRVINNLGMVDKTQIEIRSQRLAEVMAEIFEGVRGLNLSASPPTVSSPTLMPPCFSKHIF